MLKLRDIQIEHATGFVVTDEPVPRFTLLVDSDDKDACAAACSIIVRDGDRICWNSGKVENGEITHIPYSGKKLTPCTAYQVEATLWDNLGNCASAQAIFETGKLGTAWQGKWITHPVYKIKGRKENPPAFVFKKNFSAGNTPKSAKIYAAAFGIYTLELNGSRVGSDYLAPGFTSYRNQLQYQVYDVTEQLQQENTLYATVSGGWAVARFGLLGGNRLYESKQMLLCEIHLEYADGSTDIIGTDSSWGVSAEGPVRSAGIYDGEYYDARRCSERLTYAPAAVAKPRFKPELLATYGILPKVVQTLSPISVNRGREGLIYDFGQNFAGVVELAINGKEGQHISVRHAEVLIGGELFTAPLRTARARLDYVCRDGQQRYFPEHTFMGFRYIEVCGIEAENVQITAKVLSSITEETGSFTCSNEDVNRLQQNIRWGGMSNFVDIPTDCPQRDERLGWTGDIAVFASTACYNFAMDRFLEKWLLDVSKEQNKAGGLPVIIPCGDLPIKIVTPGWGDVCIMVPWAMYLNSGDKRILQRSYPAIQKFLARVEHNCRKFSAGDKKYIWDYGFSFGDWCAPGEVQSQWMKKSKWIATAYYANSCGIAAKMAQILGKDADAAHYREERSGAIQAYRNIFTDGNGKLHNEFQTAYVCPLYFGMTEGAESRAYAENLARLVEDAGNHLTTGFLGTPYLLFALSDNGYANKAYDLLLQDTCPSWLYEVKAGATTIWERWDALRPDGTVNLGENVAEDAKTAFGGGMVSFNHYANGAVGDWLYRRCAGIEAIEPGYRKFAVKPIPGGDLTWAKATKQTAYGEIVSHWHREKGTFTLNVTVPFNTIAVITLPNGASYEAGSGTYEFTMEE